MFDDSFSALDMKTDAHFERQLKKRYRECNNHYRGTAYQYDHSCRPDLVLDDGNMAGKGTHKELMEIARYICRLHSHSSVIRGGIGMSEQRRRGPYGRTRNDGRQKRPRTSRAP